MVGQILKKYLLSFGLTLTVLLMMSLTQAAWAYDSETGLVSPFDDYSDLDSRKSEEEDTHFLKHGKTFSLNLFLTQNNLTGQLKKFLESSNGAGGQITFFNDFHTALSLFTDSSTHIMNIEYSDSTSGAKSTLQGTMSFSSIGLALKGFIPTKNLIQSFASLNPYGLVGFQSNKRQTTTSGQIYQEKTSAFGVTLGAGMEYRSKNNYIVFLETGVKQLNFPGEEIVLEETIHTGLTFKGQITYFRLGFGVIF